MPTWINWILSAVALTASALAVFFSVKTVATLRRVQRIRDQREARLNQKLTTLRGHEDGEG